MFGLKIKKAKKHGKSFILGGVAVLLTLIGITGGNTYAKYVTSTNVPTQSATVAKWGYVLSADATNLFSTDYGLSSGATFMTANPDGTGIVATGTTGRKNLVAPGSKGSTTITISGSAEVAALFTLEVKFDKDVSYNGYAPIKWTIQKTGETTATPIDKTQTYNASISFDANPATAINTTYTLSWEWPYETGTTVEEKAINNAYDTILGYVADGVTLANIKDINSNYYNKALADIIIEPSAEVKIEIGVTITAKVEQIAK